VRAVHYIHSKKIIHRDLKLENVLLDSQNRFKIVDFGLSDYVSSKERTVTDAGTEAYLAPEVFNGSSGDSDPYKIDVWGLGVILYALAHGRLPFGRPDRDTCAKLDADGLNFKDSVSTGYRRIVKSMLIPSPSRRAPVDEITIDSWVTIHRFAECDNTRLLEEQTPVSTPRSGAASSSATGSAWGGSVPAMALPVAEEILSADGNTARASQGMSPAPDPVAEQPESGRSNRYRRATTQASSERTPVATPRTRGERKGPGALTRAGTSVISSVPARGGVATATAREKPRRGERRRALRPDA